MSNVFLSIVIPVYNGGKYITRCLDSIWQQGMNEYEYEVVCVNDCSTDNTVEVIQGIQRNHPNLRLLSNTVNKRAGGSRNYGVVEAGGEYVTFIDADDYYHEGALRKAVEYLKKRKIDILMCDSSRELPDKRSDTLIHHFSNHSVLSGRNFLLENGYPFAPWKFLFRKKLMLDNQCFFEEYVQAEDIDWVYRMGLLAKTMQYQPILLVHYVLVSNSLSGANANERNLKDTMYCGKRLLKLALSYKEIDNDAYRAILNVAYLYYKEGIKIMCMLTLSVKNKTSIIRSIECREGFLHYITQYPVIFSALTNVLKPLYVLLVKIRRQLRGRL